MGLVGRTLGAEMVKGVVAALIEDDFMVPLENSKYIGVCYLGKDEDIVFLEREPFIRVPNRCFILEPGAAKSRLVVEHESLHAFGH